jgi:hypothetical protein
MTAPSTPESPVSLTETEGDFFRHILRGNSDEPVSVHSLSKWIVEKYTPEGVSAILEKLVSVGLLERSFTGATETSNPPKSYALPSTSDGFVKLARTYIAGLRESHEDGWRHLGCYFLSSAYARSHLTTELVNGIITQRGVAAPNLERPILGLIEISPTALLDFLGPWEPVEPRAGSSGWGIGAVEHLIYRWVFDCIADLAVTRTVPDYGDVMRASVRPEHTLAQRHDPPLLELCLWDGTVIGFEAGFDTDHEYYQGEDDGPDDITEIERNPENCWVEIWKDHIPPRWGEQGLEARLGYSFDKPELLKQILAESVVPGTKNKRPSFLKQTATLGDAILESYVTTELLRRKKDLTAQQINDLRKQVVKNETLAALAMKLGLGVDIQFPYAPPGSPSWVEEKSGMLGDSLEALIGVAYLDGGLKGASAVAEKLMRERLEEVAPLHLHRLTPGPERDGTGTQGL